MSTTDSSDLQSMLKSNRAKLSKVIALYKSGLKERLSLGKQCLCEVPLHSKEPTLSHYQFKNPVLRSIQLTDLECRNREKANINLQKRQSRQKVQIRAIQLKKTEKQRWFLCGVNECNYSSNRKGDLNKHRIIRHSTTKRFKCPKQNCKFATNYKDCLLAHLFKHCGVYPYRCKVTGCTFRGRYRSTLRKHQRRLFH